eukprot:778461_1
MEVKKDNHELWLKMFEKLKELPNQQRALILAISGGTPEQKLVVLKSFTTDELIQLAISRCSTVVTIFQNALDLSEPILPETRSLIGSFAKDLLDPEKEGTCSEAAQKELTGFLGISDKNQRQFVEKMANSNNPENRVFYINALLESTLLCTGADRVEQAKRTLALVRRKTKNERAEVREEILSSFLMGVEAKQVAMFKSFTAAPLLDIWLSMLNDTLEMTDGSVSCSPDSDSSESEVWYDSHCGQHDCLKVFLNFSYRAMECP